MSAAPRTGPAQIETILAGVDPRVFDFIGAWRAARSDEHIPYRSAFDPLVIPALLKFVWLYEYDPGIGDFVCRLAGEDVNDAWGEGIKGRTLRQIIGPEDHGIVCGRWREIVSQEFIQYGRARERLSKQQTRRAERILAPMKSDDGTVDVVLGMSLYRIGPIDRERPTLIPEDIIRVPCVDI